MVNESRTYSTLEVFTCMLSVITFSLVLHMYLESQNTMQLGMPNGVSLPQDKQAISTTTPAAEDGANTRLSDISGNETKTDDNNRTQEAVASNSTWEDSQPERQVHESVAPPPSNQSSSLPTEQAQLSSTEQQPVPQPIVDSPLANDNSNTLHDVQNRNNINNNNNDNAASELSLAVFPPQSVPRAPFEPLLLPMLSLPPTEPPSPPPPPGKPPAPPPLPNRPPRSPLPLPTIRPQAGQVGLWTQPRTDDVSALTQQRTSLYSGTLAPGLGAAPPVADVAGSTPRKPSLEVTDMLMQQAQGQALKQAMEPELAPNVTTQPNISIAAVSEDYSPAAGLGASPTTTLVPEKEREVSPTYAPSCENCGSPQLAGEVEKAKASSAYNLFLYCFLFAMLATLIAGAIVKRPNETRQCFLGTIKATTYLVQACVGFLSKTDFASMLSSLKTSDHGFGLSKLSEMGKVVPGARFIKVSPARRGAYDSPPSATSTKSGNERLHMDSLFSPDSELQTRLDQLF